jgi:Leucine-rich repeat (LRR) protein
MAQNMITKLQQTREALSAVTGDLQALQELVFSGASEVLEQHVATMNKVDRLRRSYEELLEGYAVDLGDGQVLRRDQYEALQIFAANNQIKLGEVISRLHIESRGIVGCNFRRFKLKTLEGLECIDSIRSLDISDNWGLRSFSGLPVLNLEKLTAWRTGIKRDLSGLERARKLKILDVSLTQIISLSGLPVSTIEELSAYGCQLRCDLSLLKGARNLKALRIMDNSGIQSLRGLPHESLERLWAGACALAGDLSCLKGLTKLKHLDISENEGITSLYGLPVDSIEVLGAACCGLTGDHSFLLELQRLRELDIRGNRALDLDTTRFNPSVVVV